MDTFSKYQESVLDEWSQYGMYKLFDINKSSSNTFKFLSGPPFCSGKLHIGHCAVETIKSTIINYKLMSGYNCDTKLGYDCHGLPIESVANRELGISSLQDLEKVGMVQFNQFCKDTIKSCARDWEPVYNSIGRWADFDNVYKTVDAPYMNNIWWAFSELYKKGLIYRGYKITPYSAALQSPLSNFEAAQGYKEVDCRSAYVRFLVNPYTYSIAKSQLPKSQLPYIIPFKDETTREYKLCYLVAWTTTPWTLPANIALCVNRNLDYDIIEVESESTDTVIYILGAGTAANAGLKIKTLLATVKGEELIGIAYTPVFPHYHENMNIKKRGSPGWFHVICDDYVLPSTNGTGTAIVHIAPMFGEDDFRICQEQGLITNSDIPSMELLDKECKYNNARFPFAGLLVFDVETPIIKELKASHALVKIQQIRHEYPHCYRTDTPLVYRTYESFYVDVQSIKSRMLELNTQIRWYPESIGTQRFHNWLEGARDWCISRSRYFGTPIPVWIADEDKSLLVIGSIKELENASGLLLQDIHPEYVNDIVITQNGKTYRRVPDIFDCWFESGCVPFAQNYNTSASQNLAPADFIVEGLDQTRGWFYTLLVLSTALFDTIPAKGCY